MAAQHNVVAFNSRDESETFVNSKQAEKLLNTAGKLASSHLKKLLQYMFDNVDHHFMGQLDKAESSVRKGIRLDLMKQIPQMHLLLANILTLKSDFSGAVDAMRQYLNIISP